MQARSLYDFKSILRNGGALDLHVSELSISEVLELVRSMLAQSILTLRGLDSIALADLVRICRYAKGQVVFVM